MILFFFYIDIFFYFLFWDSGKECALFLYLNFFNFPAEEGSPMEVSIVMYSPLVISKEREIGEYIKRVKGNWF